MSNLKPHQDDVWQATGPFLMARALLPSGSSISTTSISSVTYTVYDRKAATAVTTAGSLNTTDVVFDTLQTDGRWTADNTGYNFGAALSTGDIPNAGRQYEVDIVLTPNSGAPFPLRWVLDSKPRYTS